MGDEDLLQTTTTTTVRDNAVLVPGTTGLNLNNATTGGSSGFFSLDHSDIAERARRMKEEKQQHHAATATAAPLIKEVNGSNGTITDEKDSSNGVTDDNEGGGDQQYQHNNNNNNSKPPVVDSLHEFDGMFISNQNYEKDNSFHNSLTDGFRKMKESRDGTKKDNNVFPDDPTSIDTARRNRQQQYCATVNFIDPTTRIVPVTSPTSKAPNMLQQQSMLQKQDSDSLPTSSIENVYEKLTYIFERDYNSTLRSVQYKNIRTGENDIISSLPINAVLTRTGGSGGSSSPSTATSGTTSTTAATADKNFNTPWGGTAATAIVPVSDPSEWHVGPLCHVYIAACDNAEQYRTKIRPALQAFVSQIESAASNTAANQQGGHSADYLIVYIPTGNKRSRSDPSTPDNAGNSAHRSVVSTAFFQKARQRFSGGISTSSGGTSFGDDADEVGSGASLDNSDDGGDDTLDDPESTTPGGSGVASVSVALNLLSRTERALYKTIAADFPNGRACVLSPTSLDRSDEALSNSTGVAIRTQEWNTFNRMLGMVIVNGFMDRSRRYKDELKRLDAQRAVAATAAKNQQQGGKSLSSNNSNHKPSPYAFNLSHFFLVKESLAFSFEQMQLPAEALLQYDEFRLYMPDLTDQDERKVRRARRKSKALADDEGSSSSLTQLADAGEFLGFRKRIRSEYDLTAVLDVMRRYLFAREISLLIRMEQPVELLSRCHAFVKVMYSIMMRGASELSDDDQARRRASAAMWVVQFSWDVKCACDLFFSLGAVVDDGDRDGLSVDSFGSDPNGTSPGQADEAVAAKLSELMEVSRLMLMELGDTELKVPNPIRVLQKKLPDDLQQPWPRWTSPVLDTTDENSPEKRTKRTSTDIHNEVTERQFLVNTDSLSSPEHFEETYLELCRAIVRTNRRANRSRLAARLQSEIGEYHVRKGDLAGAVPMFKAMVKMYRRDQWDRCHFWRLFRLAYCQRTTAQSTDYLKTLVSCFSPRIATIAPAKALNILQNDLEQVLEHPLVGNARYGKLAFFETSLKLSNTSEESTLGEGADRKQVVKRICSVGESVNVIVSIKSWLARTVELKSVKLFIVTFGDFASIIGNSESVEEEDATKVISLSSPVTVQPGVNTFTFDWTPSSAGQFILSTVELVWKQGYFYYDSMELPDPLLAIDVLPSEPTHLLTLEPHYLVPGNDQEVRISFEAGTDIVTSAKLVLSGTMGVSIMPPGEDPESGKWMKECEVPLQACSPGEKLQIVSYVRCDLIEKFTNGSISQVDSMDMTHGLSVKAFTTYLHPEVENTSSSEVPAMKNVIECFSPISGKSALSVASVGVTWLEPSTKLLLNVLVTSNTSNPFSVAEWSINLPPPLTVVDGVNLNDDLLKRSVSDGDKLSFAFECEVNHRAQGGVSREPEMKLKLNDHHGKVVSLELPLELNELYSDLLTEPSSKTTVPLLGSLKYGVGKGPVGNSVAMTYTVDISNFISPNGDAGVFIYSLSWEDSDWLIGGKVNGVMTRSESQISCEVVGVPTIPGHLDRIAKLDLSYVDSEGESVSVPVHIFQPEPFVSLSNVRIVTVAHPSSHL